MRIIRRCALCDRDTITENECGGVLCFDCSKNEQTRADLAIGRKWRENSSLEEWFPFTAEEMRKDAATLGEAIELLKRGTETLSDLSKLSNVNPEIRRLLFTIAEAFAQFTMKHKRSVQI